MSPHGLVQRPSDKEMQEWRHRMSLPGNCVSSVDIEPNMILIAQQQVQNTSVEQSDVFRHQKAYRPSLIFMGERLLNAWEWFGIFWEVEAGFCREQLQWSDVVRNLKKDLPDADSNHNHDGDWRIVSTQGLRTSRREMRNYDKAGIQSLVANNDCFNTCWSYLAQTTMVRFHELWRFIRMNLAVQIHRNLLINNYRCAMLSGRQKVT